MSLADTRRTKPRQQPFSRFGSEHHAASSGIKPSLWRLPIAVKAETVNYVHCSSQVMATGGRQDARA